MHKVLLISTIFMMAQLSFAGWYDGSDGKTYYMPSNLQTLENQFLAENPRPSSDDPSYVNWEKERSKFLSGKVEDEMKKTQPGSLSDTGKIQYKEGFGFTYIDQSSSGGLPNVRGLGGTGSGILTVNQAIERNGNSETSRNGPPQLAGSQNSENNSRPVSNSQNVNRNSNNRSPASTGMSANSLSATSLDSSGSGITIGGMCTQDKLISLGMEHQETIRAAKAVLNKKLADMNCNLYQ